MSRSAAGAPEVPEAPEMITLPRGRHGIDPELVRESQRRRLMTAAAESLSVRGYGRIATTEVTKRARVSTAAFYKHFDDLWACLLGAYEADAALLCERIDEACAAAAGAGGDPVLAATESGLALLAADPALAHLLTAEPPPQAPTLRAARRDLVERLAARLRGAREGEGEGGGGAGRREERLVAGALALVASRSRGGGPERLEGLSPALAAMLRG